MKKVVLNSFGAFTVAILALTITVASTEAYARSLKAQAKTAFNTKPTGRISPWEAMQIAAKASGGRPFQALYEFDEGQWTYGVVVVKNHKLLEVELDPSTGKVGDTETVNPDEEAKELKSVLTRAAN